ncbi:hypothetical protein EAS62_04220 [Bradyrhizobium zhanjiangense]|uniref:Sulfur globule protein n=3 Tax=Nitrobacteraceae TaxID=41294 RepID=A0ABY0DSK4_9BRAD|nr:hypothetical protein EAS62_04220 [Bradyrhizobium zhanjiangense]
MCQRSLSRRAIANLRERHDSSTFAGNLPTRRSFSERTSALAPVEDMMKKLALAASLMVAAGLTLTSPALAKGGHGHGHGYGRGHAMGYHYHGTPPGWYHGRKVGWRGMGCPPGLWKQGRC